MKVLFVTPGEFSAGEAITAVHCAERIAARGGQVHFLASAFTARFVKHPVTLMSESLSDNQKLFDEVLSDFAPNAVVFADFAMTFFSSGVTPLGDGFWLRHLDAVDAELFTFDHLGYSQGPMNMFYGPPHLGIVESIVQPPPRVNILLPCPVMSPDDVPGRRGVPFKYWTPPNVDADTKAAVRKKHAGDDLLVFHSVPTWAHVWAEHFGHPYYDFLAEILSSYLAGLPVTVISVNHGTLLGEGDGITVKNLSTLPREEYEALILSCDLFLTENKISVSLGKAVCSQVPGAILKNSRFAKDILGASKQADGDMRGIVEAMEKRLPGAVYPYEVFPIWGKRQVEKLGVFKESSYPDGVDAIEIFGGHKLRRDRFHLSLQNQGERSALMAKQKAYADKVADLPEIEDVIAELIRP